MATLDFEPVTYEDIPAERRPSVGQALVPIAGMILFLAVGSVLLDMDPHVPLLWGIALTGVVGRYWLGIGWTDLFDGVADSITMGLQAILILFVIYGLIATWVAAGTIPALMYYGLEFLTPAVFLPVAALLALVVSFAIGSSWTTAGTLGVAFVGIGSGLGVPAGMTAGAVLSGAYAGDKQSPLSDTTNLAAAVTNTDLMDHVRAMRTGTVVAFGIALAVYAVLGAGFQGAIPTGRVAAIQGALAGTYALTPLVFLPLVVTFGLALRGYPALPSLVAGAFTGVAVAVGVQGVPFAEAWVTFQSGTSPQTGHDLVNSLLASGGLVGSAWTVTIVVLALSLGGVLERTGSLAVLAHAVERGVSSAVGLTLGTAASALSMNVLAAEQYMSIVVPGMSLRALYDDMDLESTSLSRAVESTGTTTSALIPWNAGGAYMAGVFGVSVLSYAPYYVFGYLTPLVFLALVATGRGVDRQGASSASATAAPSDD